MVLSPSSVMRSVLFVDDSVSMQIVIMCSTSGLAMSGVSGIGIWFLLRASERVSVLFLPL